MADDDAIAGMLRHVFDDDVRGLAVAIGLFAIARGLNRLAKAVESRG